MSRDGVLLCHTKKQICLNVIGHYFVDAISHNLFAIHNTLNKPNIIKVLNRSLKYNSSCEPQGYDNGTR